MTILVTGGSGFIGTNFILKCIKEEFDELIVNLDKLTYAGNINNLKCIENKKNYIFIRGDIKDSALIDVILARYKPRAVIHFAAESHVDHSIFYPANFIQTNVVGTFVLLERAKKFWKNLSGIDSKKFRFCHVSTDEVYGTLEANDQPFEENHCYKPNSPYSASKASSNHFVRAYFSTYGFPVLTINCSNNYGPYQLPEKLIPHIINNALHGKSLPVYGDGLQIRDWLFVEDHCTAILNVLEKGSIGEVYNVGGANEKTNIEVIYYICKVLDKLKPKCDTTSYKSQIIYVKDRLGHDRRYSINAAKIHQSVSWSPVTCFENGLKKTINWYLDNQLWVLDAMSRCSKSRNLI